MKLILLLLFAAVAGCAQAGPLPGYPTAATPFTGTETVIGTQTGVTKNFSTLQLQQYILNSPYPAPSAPLAGTETIPGIQSSAVKNFTPTALKNFVLVNVTAYGAVCDGSTNDATAINAALTAAGVSGGKVRIPAGLSCKFNSVLNIPANVTLEGNGQQGAGGLIVGAINLSPAIQFGGSGSGIANVHIVANAAGTNTTGAIIQMATAGFGQRIDSVEMDGPCIGADIEGNTSYVDRFSVSGALGVGGLCGGWTIGALSSGGTVIDPRITNSTVGGPHSPAPLFGQLLYDVGGLYEEHNDFLYGSYGTYIRPGAGQKVEWTFFVNTTLGDTNVAAALSVDTPTVTSTVYSFLCTNCWASEAGSSSSSNLLFNNTGASATNAGFHFIGLRDYVYGGTNGGVYMNGGSDFSFENSSFCGLPNTVFLISSGISNIRVNGARVGAACDGQTSIATTGFNFAGSNTGVILSNLDMTGVATPITGSFTGVCVNIINYTCPLSASTVGVTGQITSTLANGTAPMVVASQTQVANLNSTFLQGATWASPIPLGSTTPASVNTTSLQVGGRVAMSSTAPTYTSGFSTGTPAIAGTGSNAFTVTIGATPGATGVLAMPAATTGYVCSAVDRTTAAGTIRETATTSTSVTFALASTVASDVLQFQCQGY